MIAKNVPTTAPSKTSVGKCINRYNLLKPINSAAAIGISPHFLLKQKTETAAAKAIPVCVDGQENDVGALTSKGMEGSRVKGRGLAIRSFKTNC